MMADDEAQKVSRRSALIIAKLKDASIRAEVMANLDSSGSGTTSKDMLSGVKTDIEYVQVFVVIDARANMNASAISHKQFVTYAGTHQVSTRETLQEVVPSWSLSSEFVICTDERQAQSSNVLTQCLLVCILIAVYVGLYLLVWCGIVQY